MNRFILIIIFTAATFFIFSSCEKDIKEDDIIITPDTISDYEIPIEEALITLTTFLKSEDMLTKVSAINNGNFKISKWSSCSASKMQPQNPSSLYCIEFSNELGGAILAADSRQKQRIYCVTESSKITVNDLASSENSLFVNKNNKNNFKEKEDVCLVDIYGCDETFVPALICRSSYVGENPNIVNNRPQTIKYGPLLETKWGQGQPFNKLMDGALVGCVPVAAAQLVFFFHDKMDSTPSFSGKKCDWDIIGTVMNYLSPYNFGTLEAQDQVGHYMFSIKQNCGIAINKTSGTVGDIEKCIKQFGFRNIKHNFAHFGGDSHDIGHINEVISMIKNNRPVIMLSFCAQGWPWDWTGHAYVIDGYKSDSTGEYLHINWGWNGIQDGYYAKGCFDENAIADIEDGFDSGHIDSAPSNFNLFHYYVHYEY